MTTTTLLHTFTTAPHEVHYILSSKHISSYVPPAQEVSITPNLHEVDTDGSLREGIYRIQTEGQYYLAVDSGFVKAFPLDVKRDGFDTNGALWKIKRSKLNTSSSLPASPTPLAYQGLSSSEFGLGNSRSSSAKTVKYTLANVLSNEAVTVSMSKLLLTTTDPVEIEDIPPLEVSVRRTNAGEYQMYTTQPDELWGGFNDLYVHIGQWQLEPWGSTVFPAPVHLSPKVFPESECTWKLEFVEELPDEPEVVKSEEQEEGKRLDIILED